MCAYEHRHTDTVLWTHSFSHTHSWTYLLMPDNMQTPPTCSYSPAYSLNPALSHLCVIHACSSVHVHALFRHAMSIHAWVLFYSMHMYSYWVFFSWWTPVHIDPSSSAWSDTCDWVVGQPTIYKHMQWEGLIPVQHSSLQAPRSYRLFGSTAEVSWVNLCRHQPETLLCK